MDRSEQILEESGIAVAPPKRPTASSHTSEVLSVPSSRVRRCTTEVTKVVRSSTAMVEGDDSSSSEDKDEAGDEAKGKDKEEDKGDEEEGDGGESKDEDDEGDGKDEEEEDKIALVPDHGDYGNFLAILMCFIFITSNY